jgi:hypothetical protein
VSKLSLALQLNVNNALNEKVPKRLPDIASENKAESWPTFGNLKPRNPRK